MCENQEIPYKELTTEEHISWLIGLLAAKDAKISRLEHTRAVLLEQNRSIKKLLTKLGDEAYG